MPFIFDWECVISRSGKILVENDPDDPGGETFCGLDRRSHPKLNFSIITAEEICREYLLKYWRRYDCDSFLPGLGESVFNCCVNAGWGRAQKILAGGAKTAAQFLDAQEDFYERLAEQKPKLAKFLAGWKNRTAALRRFLSFDTPATR